MFISRKAPQSTHRTQRFSCPSFLVPVSSIRLNLAAGFATAESKLRTRVGCAHTNYEAFRKIPCEGFGGAGRGRTSDALGFNQALYH